MLNNVLKKILLTRSKSINKKNILVDGLKSTNTGNVIFLRLGERVVGKKSSMQRITIKNVVADVPFGKADAGYDYEGPIEDMPRNVSPIVIAGLPGQYIKEVSFNDKFTDTINRKYKVIKFIKKFKQTFF